MTVIKVYERKEGANFVCFLTSPPPTTPTRCRAGVAVVNSQVFAVGGFNGSLRVRTVDVFDPLKDTWSNVASMEARRSTLGAAVLNNQIFAVGGFDGSSGLSSVCYLINRLS